MHVSSSEQKLESQLRFRRCQADRDVQSELAGPEDGQSWCRARLGVLSYAAPSLPQTGKGDVRDDGRDQVFVS